MFLSSLILLYRALRRQIVRQGEQTRTISDLPPEILGIIFSLGYEDALHDAAFSLNVAAVCSQWRSIALSLPQLWTMIKINHRNHNILRQRNPQSLPIQRPSQRDLTCLMLSRSGTRSLGISIEFESCANTAELGRAADTLVDYRERWRAFSLNGDGRDGLMKVIEGCKGFAPCLETVSIGSLREWPSMVELSEFFSDGLPNLNRLDLHDLAGIGSLPCCPNLRTLELCRVRISVALLLDVVAQCVLLETIQLLDVDCQPGAVEHREKIGGAQPIIQANNLRHLAIIDGPLEGVSQFLSNLDLSSLEHLRISSRRRQSSAFIECASRIAYCQPPLQVLHLQVPHDLHQAISQLLVQTPTVVNLYLRFTGSQAETSQTLIDDLSNPLGVDEGGMPRWILPRLRKFWPTTLATPRKILELCAQRAWASDKGQNVSKIQELGVSWSGCGLSVHDLQGVQVMDSRLADVFDPNYACVDRCRTPTESHAT